MQLRKYRWSKDYESAEEELRLLLDARAIAAERRTAEEGDVFPACLNPSGVRLWCAEGMFTVTAHEKSFSMQPGDTLEIPEGIVYDISARFGGCVWYQA